jgi:ABC-type microcin C transport system permease subunit YejB
MWTYVLQRLLLLIPTLLGITFIAFALIHLAPGDPAELRAGGGLGAAGSEGLSRFRLGCQRDGSAAHVLSG